MKWIKAIAAWVLSLGIGAGVGMVTLLMMAFATDAVKNADGLTWSFRLFTIGACATGLTSLSLPIALVKEVESKIFWRWVLIWASVLSAWSLVSLASMIYLAAQNS